jgi:hypothetical protein
MYKTKEHKIEYKVVLVCAIITFLVIDTIYFLQTNRLLSHFRFASFMSTAPALIIIVIARLIHLSKIKITVIYFLVFWVLAMIQATARLM